MSHKTLTLVLGSLLALSLIANLFLLLGAESVSTENVRDAGIPFNSKRVELGIPIVLGSNQEAYAGTIFARDYTQRWTFVRKPGDLTYMNEKLVSKDGKGGLDSDITSFVHHLPGEGVESLHLFYDFGENLSPEERWMVVYYQGETPVKLGSLTTGRGLSLAEGDSVLASWGLNRENWHFEGAEQLLQDNFRE